MALERCALHRPFGRRVNVGFRIWSWQMNSNGSSKGGRFAWLRRPAASHRTERTGARTDAGTSLDAPAPDSGGPTRPWPGPGTSTANPRTAGRRVRFADDVVDIEGTGASYREAFNKKKSDDPLVQIRKLLKGGSKLPKSQRPRLGNVEPEASPSPQVPEQPGASPVKREEPPRVDDDEDDLFFS